MDREKLREEIKFFLMTTFNTNFEANLQKLIDTIELEHRKALRPLCVSFAEVGIAIIKDAQDTCWVTPSETALDRIFNELALEMDAREGGPEMQLKEFIQHGVQKSWPEKLLEAKSKEPVQLELSPKSET